MGVKEQEFFRRLHEEGIPADEVSVLSREVEEEKAREKAPQTNPQHFENPTAQKISDMWFSQRSTATVEQKDKVGLAYITDILQLGEEIAQRFAADDRIAWDEVGVKQSGIPSVDTTSFWTKIREIFPDTYDDDNIALLILGNLRSVFHLLWQIEIPLAEESPVLHALAINAHAYK